ncbi:histone-lysine N-methyltransferase, H3 lysine-9 specific SUVH1-like [Rutidosis leptorrhynchoides]|uniref:histone-lysine N-methyltransferase, H3 lysine-9 specific SUVH1-like n=1 Tax=Rutidosis leptorrhynchoides TaxID=125765 RepID=UPI003A9A10E8
MDHYPGENSMPETVDKTRVLDVKPIRCLLPIFPSSPNPQGAPFACAPPTGPFPPGVSPFYPFFTPSDHSQTPISNAVPINSFRTTANGTAGPSKRGRKKRVQPPQEAVEDISDEEDTSQRRRRRGRPRGDVNSEVDTDAAVEDILASFNLVEFDSNRRTEGDKESVAYVRLVFDLLRRKLTQIDELRGENPGAARRPDLKAGTVLLHKGIRTNVKRRVGAVPGVEIGDIFFFRIEMCVVGLHAPSMSGIDYMSVRIGENEEPIAVSIVASGGYGDNDEDADVLIYSGHGGNENADQKLERGNLALEKSLHRGNEVRVIRGIKEANSYSAKIYVYDGLYKIQESWIDKGKTGFSVFKYKLARLPGQAAGWATWKMIQQWKDGLISRDGVILPDLTSGAEKIPVSLVNDIDGEKGPSYFNYVPTLKYPRPLSPVEGSVGCFCHGGCTVGNAASCTCHQKNGHDMVYLANGIMVTPKVLIHECGSSCQCPPTCRNRVSQGGLRVRLEVFRTRNKGWGLRSWDFIRAGSYICEYAGEVVHESLADELWGENEEDYIFDATRSYRPMEIMPADFNEPAKMPFPMIISAKTSGNVARFMNHSCFPNVFWQPVSRQNDKECDLHIVFYAIKHIPPMTELTYNYGMVTPEESNQRRKTCFCGAEKCRGYFY